MENKVMKLKQVVTMLSFAVLAATVATGCSKNKKDKTAKAKGDTDTVMVDASAPPEVRDAIAAAQESIAKANANKWIWRDTEKMVTQAAEAQKKGDSKGAIKLANTAKQHADIAIQQYSLENSMDRGLKSAKATKKPAKNSKPG